MHAATGVLLYSFHIYISSHKIHLSSIEFKIDYIKKKYKNNNENDGDGEDKDKD